VVTTFPPLVVPLYRKHMSVGDVATPTGLASRRTDHLLPLKTCLGFLDLLRVEIEPLRTPTMPWLTDLLRPLCRISVSQAWSTLASLDEVVNPRLLLSCPPFPPLPCCTVLIQHPSTLYCIPLAFASSHHNFIITIIHSVHLTTLTTK
jgi:hypothetical protein